MQPTSPSSNKVTWIWPRYRATTARIANKAEVTMEIKPRVGSRARSLLVQTFRGSHSVSPRVKTKPRKHWRCAPPHHLSTSLRHPSAPFNWHRARVRRNRGRLPSSRCIESAQTLHPRAPTLLHRASDTTLGLIVTYLDRDMEFVWTPSICTRLARSRSVRSGLCRQRTVQ